MNKKYKQAFLKQRDHSDCGVACLSSLVTYYGGEANLEKLREISGTSKEGTTLLGLFQAAQQLGFNATAFEADLPNLQKLTAPVILHVIIDKTLQHYVICYEYTNGNFIISDPADGLKLLSADELDKIWTSKTLLMLEPTEEFVKAEKIKKEKLSWLKQLVADDTNILTTSLIIGAAISILTLATAVFSQRLIDDILPGKKTQKLFVGLALLFFLLIVKSGLSYLRQHFLNKQAQKFNNRVTNRFYDSLLYLPSLFFDTRKTGELVARLNDTVRIQNAISYMSANLMIDVLMIIITSVFIFTYSSTIGFLALLSVPLYALAVYLFHKQIVDSQRKLMVAYAKNESNYVDTIQGAGTIKVSNKQALFSEKTKTVYGFFQQSMFDLGKVRIRFGFLTDVIASLLIGIIITKGSLDVLNAGMKLGAFMAILQMVGIIMPAAGRVALTNIQLQEGKVAFDRMFEYTSIPPEFTPQEDQNKKTIEGFEHLQVKNILFRFPGRRPLLHDISFEVRRGQMIALLGESGCGKSTMMQILQKFYAFESGEITVNGIKWNELSTVSWRNAIAVVPQEIKIFSGTLLDNICMGDGVAEAQNIATFCHAYGFDKFFAQFPQNYFTILGEDGVAISGGQRQLVGLARALYKKPQLLLLDEATSAMDRNTESFILNMIKNVSRDMGIIMVTHKVKTARDCDHIFVIENGRTNLNGRHEELIQTSSLYTEFWNA